ncbi:MAG: hypothetical protein KDC98_17710, partial [Planctomycetes bacterium]|nr:hypothetical protein [Planctomycetota bacterium]
GFPGCALRVRPDFVVLVPLQNGLGIWTLAIPAATGLIGTRFFTQAMALDPGGPIGLAVTPGGAGVVGGS